MRLERYFGVKSDPGNYLLNLRVENSNSIFRSAKTQSDVEHAVRHVPLHTGSPYTATIGGTSTSPISTPFLPVG